MSNILILEDDRVLNRLLVDQLIDAGYQVEGVASWKEAQEYLAKREPNLILMDVRLPDADGLELLPTLAQNFPVILLTAHSSVRNAVKAIKQGATEYLTKPVDAEELELVVARALETAELRQDHQFCKARLQARAQRHAMVGNSPALNEVQELIEAVAPSDMTVLIQGESGAGKELVAQSIHRHGPRAKRNFVAVDCCTLQEKLFESELFGHERGSFTGADRQKKGLIEGANGGTLFLDEIGEIEPPIQAKLLRFLETGIFRRLGGTKDLTSNVRVVAATNRDIEKMSQEGQFRPDLYYRLSAFVVRVPPLRERRDDIAPLAEYFIQNHNFSRRVEKKIAPAAIKQLRSYDWPGNIRELKNVVERAIILSREGPAITPEHLSFGSGCKPPPGSVSLTFDHEPSLGEIEQEYLGQLLDKYQGHRAAIAQVLGVSERNIYRLLKRHDLS
jgi:DNA-binding NtrC family response regulator